MASENQDEQPRISREYPDADLYIIPSTGNPDEDQAEIDAYVRRERLMAEGWCPNSGGQTHAENVAMVVEDAYTRSCPICGFCQHSNVPEFEVLPPAPAPEPTITEPGE